MTEPATCGPCLCGPITFKGTLEGSACVDHVDIYYMLEDGCNDYTPEGILEFAVLNGDFRTCPPEGIFAVSTTNIDASGNWEVVWNESCDLSIPGLYKFIAVAEPKVQDGLPCVYDVEYSCVNNYWDISIDEPYGLICENTQMSGTIQIPFCCDAIETVDISYYDGCEWICLGTTEIVWANSCDCGCTPCEGSCCDSQYGTWTFCRITSYNVCYTKLLRFKTVEYAKGITSKGTGVLSPNESTNFPSSANTMNSFAW